MVSAPNQLPTAKWSVEDYHRMIAAGILCDRHVELLEGDIVETTPTDPLHDGTGDAISDYLRDCFSTLARIREGKPITLLTSEPQPDIAIVERRDYRDHHPFVENIFLLIEIAKSRPVRDLKTKRPIYAQAGIQDYWVVNLQTDELTIFREPAEGDYLMSEVLTDGEICPLAFPEMVLSVKRLLNRPAQRESTHSYDSPKRQSM